MVKQKKVTFTPRGGGKPVSFLVSGSYKRKEKESEYCENTRPPRDVICQKKKGHKGRHLAVIFWE